MKSMSKYISFKMFALFNIVAVVTSCNKDLPLPTPIAPPQGSGTETIGSVLNSEPNYSIFKAAATRVGVLSSLSDINNVFTLFLPDNDAFVLSGIPSEDVIGLLPIETVGAIVKYHLIPGQRLTSADIPTTFPNIQEPSALTVGAVTPLVPFNLFSFPSKRANGFWLNNIPVIQPDIPYTNGVIHKVAAIVSPPALLLGWQNSNSIGLLSDPQYSLFDSLIVRGDVGVTDTTMTFKYALNQPLANLTVFAPTNTAVRQFITAASGGMVPAGAPDAVFAGFIGAFLPATSAQGIVAYHILPTRAFSVNFSTTSTITPTLVPPTLNPGVSVQAFFTGPVVDSLKVLGLAPSNGGVPATSKPSSNFDKNAVNGVLHAIDKVLLPQ